MAVSKVELEKMVSLLESKRDGVKWDARQASIAVVVGRNSGVTGKALDALLSKERTAKSALRNLGNEIALLREAISRA